MRSLRTLGSIFAPGAWLPLLPPAPAPGPTRFRINGGYVAPVGTVVDVRTSGGHVFKARVVKIEAGFTVCETVIE